MKLIKHSGFTLFELLISISIIGILMSVAVVSFSVVQKKARDSRRIQDMNAVQKAAEEYYILSGYSYPTAFPHGGSWSAGAPTQTIIDRLPTDPKDTGNYRYQCVVPGNGNALDGSGYCCCATMEESDKGNYGNQNCSVAGTTYFCVKSQQ